MRAALLPLAICLTASAAAQSSVWVIDDDGGPGVDFLDLPPAVAAALPGDVLLVHPGSYGELLLSKGLTVVASGAVSCGRAAVTDLGASEEVLVRGLDFQDADESALTIASAAGSIWFEECSFTSTSWAGPYSQGVLLRAGSAAFLRCTFRGGGMLWMWDFLWASGLQVMSGAAAHLYDCALFGGDGTYEAHGSPGALVAGFLFASGSTFEGGDGTDEICDITGGSPYPAGDGGAGLQVAGGEAHELQCAFQGGEGGYTAFCFSGAGAGSDGPPTLVEAGSLAPVPGLKARSMSATSPVAEGNAVDVSLAGAAGDVVLLAFTTGQDALFLPELHGSLLLAQPLMVVPVGVLPAGEKLDVVLPVGLLPPGVQGLSIVGQAAFLSVAGPGFLGAGASLLLTDASIPL